MTTLPTLSAQAARLLPLLIGVVIVFNLIGFVIAVAGEYPSEFDCGSCTAGDVLADSITKGSLLAAPLTVLVILGCAAVLVGHCGRRLGALGALIGLVLGVVFMIGIWGEPLDPERSDPPLAFLVVWRVLQPLFPLRLYRCRVLPCTAGCFGATLRQSSRRQRLRHDRWRRSPRSLTQGLRPLTSR